MNLTHRKARLADLQAIIALYVDDSLGQTREFSGNDLAQSYVDAFHKIDGDPNQYLMVLCEHNNVIGTCHSTLMPSLTFMGNLRMQIEAVRVSSEARGRGIGQKMIELAIAWGRTEGATIFQLTTNKERTDALRFYEKLGFKATHEGLKLYFEQV